MGSPFENGWMFLNLGFIYAWYSKYKQEMTGLERKTLHHYVLQDGIFLTMREILVRRWESFYIQW